MRITTTTTIAAAVALLALGWAAPARAQAPTPRPATHQELGGLLDDMAGQIHSLGERLREHFGALAGREQPLISIMLAHRDELELTPAQVQALERLRSEFQKTAIRREAEIRVIETDVAALLRTEPVDLGKVEARLREAERHRTELRLARIRVIEEGKGQLSAEQRDKLARIAAEAWHPSARPHRLAPPSGRIGPQRL